MHLFYCYVKYTEIEKYDWNLDEFHDYLLKTVLLKSKETYQTLYSKQVSFLRASSSGVIIERFQQLRTLITENNESITK